jgi:hypothetical protein
LGIRSLRKVGRGVWVRGLRKRKKNFRSSER